MAKRPDNTGGKQAKASARRSGTDKRLVVKQYVDEDPETALARCMVGPFARHGTVAAAFANHMVNGIGQGAGYPASADYIEDLAQKAAKGDVAALASRMLVAQAVTLDTMFTEYARRSASNMSEYMDASERYARLAMKAQARCQATLGELAKIHQPREQIVKHVHVNDGGQAVVADEFHHHAGVQGNAIAAEQSHAPAGISPALPGPDPLGNGVPIPSREREAAMSDARRD